MLATLGCNTDSEPDGPALSATFEITEGDIARVEWEVSGGGLTTPITGLAEVTTTPTLSVAVTIMDLPVATGYGIVLTAYDAADVNICRGSASFDIVEGATTNVPIVMTCSGSLVLPAGSAGISATFQDNICPVINQINVVPQTIAVGHDATVSINANDPEGGTLAYDWTSLAGTFADPAAASTVYTCTQALDHNVSITVSDGDSFCDQTRLLNVTCVPDACIGPPVVTCDDGNQCTDDGTCDPVSGCPGSTPSLSGTVCDFVTAGDGVCDGAGVCVDCLTATDCTDDGNECTEPATCDLNSCVVTNTPVDTPCTGGICDGAGSCVGCVDAGDCADDGNDCTTAPSCTAGTCDPQTPLASGTVCSTGVCNGSGVCVECVDAGQCVDDGNQCTSGPSCTGGACDTPSNLAQGVACDFVGTLDGFCNGSGTCVECNSALDCPDDGNECTAAPSCTANACDVQAPLSSGTPCNGGLGACDGAGTCI